MEACAVICRKATVALSDANLLSPWCQSSLPEHKIGVFVRFCPPESPFSGFSSTNSAFLCAFRVWNPCFWALRAQNQGFCALLGSGTPVYGHSEHKNEDFVRFCQQDELNERNELNERDEPNERVSSQKKRVAKVVTLLSFASLL